ncbi:hypothetical protein EW145_g8545 [Phellinidium pouzarii]|uniref:Uncharacterized protein n=1 Tax=Phellinidium pouzarii TaxID=167371 RepID=A0A4S4K574_9AGAM|nr:hypothetical protein EW145_g8545 [Phellinidium pouzarii]
MHAPGDTQPKHDPADDDDPDARRQEEPAHTLVPGNRRLQQFLLLLRIQLPIPILERPLPAREARHFLPETRGA